MNQQPLRPLEDVRDLARLCARLAQPFASAEQVLAGERVSPEELERARARWSQSIAGQPVIATMFREAYAEERAILRGDRITPASAPADAPPVPLLAPPPSPQILENVDETAFLARPVLKPTLPFKAGQFAPTAIPVPPREPRTELDPDATLPISGQVEPDPPLPFVKMLPSQSHKKSRT